VRVQQRGQRHRSSLVDSRRHVIRMWGAIQQQVGDLLVSPRFDACSEALARVGNCAQPIRLRGRSQRVDTTTGEIVSTYSSEQEPSESPTCAAETVAPASARPARACTPQTCSS
jgi:hypothetical protein